MFFNFSASLAGPEKLCYFYWLQLQITCKSGWIAQAEKRYCVSKEGKSKLGQDSRRNECVTNEPQRTSAGRLQKLICPEHFTDDIERKYFRSALKRRLYNKMIYSKEIIFLRRPGGGHFLIRGEWGCAAGWGHIFTTGVTIMGLQFSIKLLVWGRTFSDFWGKRVVHFTVQQTYQDTCTVGEK